MIKIKKKTIAKEENPKAQIGMGKGKSYTASPKADGHK